MLSQLLRSHKTKAFSSKFGMVELILTQDSAQQDVSIVKVGESFQSASYHGHLWSYPPFAYIRAFDHLFEPDVARVGSGQNPVQDILLIGGGGFSYPKHVLTSRDNVVMDVVEIDPCMVKIARRYLYLDRLERCLLVEGRLNHLEIFIDDGMDYLRQSDRRYDAIINDTFEGSKAVSAFLDASGISLIKGHLNEGGMYLSNFVVDFTREGPAALNDFVRRLKSQFANVHIIDASDEEFGGADNFIVVASDADYIFSDVIPY